MAYFLTRPYIYLKYSDSPYLPHHTGLCTVYFSIYKGSSESIIRAEDN
jgi:hypothetical protein